MRNMFKSNLKRTSSLLLIGTLGLLALGNVSANVAGDGYMDETDMVAVTFWLATAMMLASTVFFMLERQNVAPKWRTSMTVAALVTGVAWYHYTYMRKHWEAFETSPLVMRYIDWLITVPLQVSEFYLILAAIGAATAALFWRLFGASLIMLLTGFLAESGELDDGLTWPLFIIGCLAWIYIIYEIWFGEAKKNVGETACALKSCEKWADKKLGGRSLSFDDATEMWGSGSFTATKGRVRVCKSCYRSWKKENKNDDMY